MIFNVTRKFELNTCNNLDFKFKIECCCELGSVDESVTGHLKAGTSGYSLGLGGCDK